MLLPGREWQEGYRFGFNGKEQDPEQLGQGNLYDYGFRIYNPRLGKFLSVDPLTQSFPMLSPYQFCSNSPVDGIDIDGLEFFDSDEALMEAKCGQLFIKLENFSGPYQACHNLITNDNLQWSDGQIGAPTVLLDFSVIQVTMQKTPNIEIVPEIRDWESITYNSTPPRPFPSLALADDDTKPVANLLRVHIPLTKQSNETLEDRRYKERVYSGTTVARGRTGASVAIAIDLFIKSSEQYISRSIRQDNEKLKRQLVAAVETIDLINNEIATGNLIPIENQNPNDLSEIFNVVLQGYSASNNDKLNRIGESILEKNHMLATPIQIMPIKYSGISGNGLDGFVGNMVPSIKLKPIEK